MILETRHLRLVSAVAEHGSLTRAGRELSLTQSALSHQLQGLEGRLGTRLFHRLGKRMVPTLAGGRLIEAARQALPHLHAAEADLTRLASGREAVLRISTQCYTCYHWLPRLMEGYRRRFPKVDVQIVADATLRPIESLLEGKIDLGVVYTDERDERLTYLPLFRDEVVLVMRPDHRLARKSWVSPTDLVDEHLIVYNAPLSESHALQRFLGPAAVWPKRFSAVQLTEGVIELVKAGAGVSPLAQWAVAPHLDGESLVARRLGRNGLHRQWSAAMVRQDPAPKFLIEFARMMSEGPLACTAKSPRPGRKAG